MTCKLPIVDPLRRFVCHVFHLKTNIKANIEKTHPGNREIVNVECIHDQQRYWCIFSDMSTLCVTEGRDFNSA